MNHKYILIILIYIYIYIILCNYIILFITFQSCHCDESPSKTKKPLPWASAHDVLPDSIYGIEAHSLLANALCHGRPGANHTETPCDFMWLQAQKHVWSMGVPVMKSIIGKHQDTSGIKWLRVQTVYIQNVVNNGLKTANYNPFLSSRNQSSD